MCVRSCHVVSIMFYLNSSCCFLSEAHIKKDNLQVSDNFIAVLIREFIKSDNCVLLRQNLNWLFMVPTPHKQIPRTLKTLVPWKAGCSRKSTLLTSEESFLAMQYYRAKTSPALLLRLTS